jgi:hypothetical protein
MSPREWESYIMNMVKKYFPDRKKDIIINNAEEDEKNASLFRLLAEKGIK